MKFQALNRALRVRGLNPADVANGLSGATEIKCGPPVWCNQGVDLAIGVIFKSRLDPDSIGDFLESLRPGDCLVGERGETSEWIGDLGDQKRITSLPIGQRGDKSGGVDDLIEPGRKICRRTVN